MADTTTQEQPKKGKVVATTRKQGETKGEQRKRASQSMDLNKALQTILDAQQQMYNTSQPGSVNPVTGTKSVVRRTTGGAREDPNAPTGLNWLEAYGPDRPGVQARQEAVNATDPGVRAQAGREAVTAQKAAQTAAGVRTAYDDTNYTPPDPNRVDRSGGISVAYQNGIPVGMNSAVPGVATNAGQPIGGFRPGEAQGPFNQAAASQYGALPGLPPGVSGQLSPELYRPLDFGYGNSPILPQPTPPTLPTPPSALGPIQSSMQALSRLRSVGGAGWNWLTR